MAFILVLLLSISAMVRVESRSSQIQLQQIEAEQNALLGLYQALGVLQAEMGPDQRVSANADVFSDTGVLTNEDSFTVENPYLVGVWDSSGDRNNTSIADRVASLWGIGDGAPIYSARTRQGFRRWLISGNPNPTNPASSYDPETRLDEPPPYFRDLDDAVKLLGDGTLGTGTTGSSPADLERKEIWAPVVEIDAGGGGSNRGRLAWAVLDEGVKARVNLTLREDPTNNAEAFNFWDSPGSLGVEAMGEGGAFESFPRDSQLPNSQWPGKAIGFDQTSLIFDGAQTQNEFGPFFHDLSFYSQSTLTNVVDGGLKRDLSTLAALGETNRPAAYANRRLYSDTNSGEATNSEADPHWAALLDYANLYQDTGRLSGTGDPETLPTAKASLTEWKGNPSEPGNGDRASIDLPLPAPDRHRLAPAISKVEFYFSLIFLPPHNVNRFAKAPDHPSQNPSFYASRNNGTFPDQNQNTIDNNGVRQLYLVATPVITLQNPYNTPLDLNRMWIVLRDPPVGFKFSLFDHVDGSPVPMTDDFIPLAKMLKASYVNLDRVGGGDLAQLRFKLSLQDQLLQPGETTVFSPQFNENETVDDALHNAEGQKHNDLDLVRGFIPDVGLMWDQFTYETTFDGGSAPAPTVRITGQVVGSDGEIVEETIAVPANQRDHGIALIRGDHLRVATNLVDGTQNAFGASEDATSDPYNGTFTVELYGSDNGTDLLFSTTGGQNSENSDEVSLLGRYVFDYNTDSLKSTPLSEREALIRKSASKKEESYEVAEGLIAIDKASYTDFDMALETTLSNTSVGEVIPYTFAAFRVAGKVTKEESSIAYYPAIPHLQTNLATLTGHYHIGEEASAFKAYDLSIEVPPGGAGRLDPALGNAGEGFHHTGQTATLGQPRATQYEIPVTPLQSIASLQHADIFGGGYLPKVRYAVGNSFAHPLLPSNAATYDSSVLGYGLFDHVYLSNFRLWDRYYFSTIADQKSVFDNSADTMEDVFDDVWRNGGAAPNASLKAYVPNETTVDEVENELMAGSTPQDDAYLKMAGYQMLEGGFNINSTSVEAWKALLATTNLAVTPLEIPTFTDGSLAFNGANGSQAIQAAFARFRIPNFDSPLDSTSNEDRSLWQGYRKLNKNQIDLLAQAIVDQVRYRGPFLSLAEFVNRRLAPSGDDRSQMGVIDAAIAAAGLNGPLDTNAGRNLDADDIAYISGNDYGMIANPEGLSAGAYSASGIPAFLSQADILQSIGPRLSARSDTFVVRAYGEVRDSFGEVTARSTCEAVVQRIPEYVDASQLPNHDTNPLVPGPDGLNSTNEMFGRQFKIVSLRWLDPQGI
ncbi:MAG: hypothetical protein GVY36_07170 [Verrucomicrobia bacterium]|jgi:hypothetical protein|nr:hypothetical protein [Verrucomicrobiota bacterium]